MRSSVIVSLLGAAAAATSYTAAQRITGDATCVNACYTISSSVTQCPDLTDAGVINCVCPTTALVQTLNTCAMCIGTLQGVTTVEQQSINSLWTACTANGTVANTPNTTTTTTSGLGNNAGNSNKNEAGASAANSDNKTGGAHKGATSAATSSAIGLVMAAGLAVLAL